MQVFFNGDLFTSKKKTQSTIEYHPNYPPVFFFQRLLEKGAKKSNSNVPTKVVDSANFWLITRTFAYTPED